MTMKNTKKVLWKFSILFVLAFCLISCGDSKQKPQEEKLQQPSPPIVEVP